MKNCIFNCFYYSIRLPLLIKAKFTRYLSMNRMQFLQGKLIVFFLPAIVLYFSVYKWLIHSPVFFVSLKDYNDLNVESVLWFNSPTMIREKSIYLYMLILNKNNAIHISLITVLTAVRISSQSYISYALENPGNSPLSL